MGAGGEVGGGGGGRLPVAQNDFRIHLEMFSKLGKSSKPVRNLFQSLEKFPNIFTKNSKQLEKFPNLLGIFSKSWKKF